MHVCLVLYSLCGLNNKHVNVNSNNIYGDNNLY